MKKQLVILSTILLLIGCGQTKKEKAVLSENAAKPDSTLISSTSDKDSPENLMKLRKESLDSEYKSYKIYNLNEIINGDFNGDGVVDKAEFIKQKNSGIIITDGKSHVQTKLGFGEKFAHMTDFNWVDFWGVLNDPTTFEILFDDKTGDISGDTTVRLKNKSIFVQADEVGGGVITFQNSFYIWIHQSD